MKLSVIVTLVDGGAALRRCLTSLESQEGAPPLEIIVPYDATVGDMSVFEQEFPSCRFINGGTLTSRTDPYSFSGQHELFDRRRAVGLAEATGDLVGMVEDRGVPRPDWAAKIVRAHEAPHACVGGGVENGRDRILNWAVYFCDFGRYQPPFEPRVAPYVTDVNLAYKRSALNTTRAEWSQRYHETSVHWALQRAGETLWLTPDIVVDQIRDDLSLKRLLAERVAWGRLFAYTRAREVSSAKRIALTLLAPVLPLVLFARLARQRLAKRVSRSSFLKASLAVAVLLMAWSFGEMLGYATGREQR